MCHQLVQCTNCDLVYADQPLSENELAHAYHVADYDSSEEANDAAKAYILAIQPALGRLARRQSALEIGTGPGIFLDYLSREGFTELVGVEPSSAAIAAAPEYRRAWIREGMFEEKDFAPESFDLICCFMTMEHVRDPDIVASTAFHLLRPGGAFVTVTHDYRSLVNRLLGRHSPIIDIEHMQLFSERSLRYLFESAGYTGVTVNTFANTYSLRYWIRLAPLPRGIKSGLSSLMASLGMDNAKLNLNVGNLITVGFKNVHVAEVTRRNRFTHHIISNLRRNRFIRFLAVGGVNTLFGFGAYSLLILTGMAVWLALLVSMLLGTMFNFLTTGGYVFQKLSLARFPRFVLCYLLVYFINLELIELILTLLNNKILAQAILVFPMAMLSYFLMARFVFASR